MDKEYLTKHLEDLKEFLSDMPNKDRFTAKDYAYLDMTERSVLKVFDESTDYQKELIQIILSELSALRA